LEFGGWVGQAGKEGEKDIDNAETVYDRGITDLKMQKH
jgi:hypothetical protein